MYLFFLLVYFDVHGTKIVLLGKKNSLYDIRTSANGSILSKINQTNLQKLKSLPNLKESQNQSFVFFQKIKSHLTWSWALGSQIWFKNWFSNAPIFFSCGPIFTSTVSKIFSLDRRIHFGTSWHPQMCHSYLKQTQQSWKKLKISPNPWFRSTANLLS